MGGKRSRTFEDNIKEIIRRSINNPETKGMERYKWVLAAIKMLQLEKMTGTAEHGSGFADIDKDEPEDELDDRGAPDEHDGSGTTRNGHGGA